MTTTDKERQAVANRLLAYTHDFDFRTLAPFGMLQRRCLAMSILKTVAVSSHVLPT